MQLQSIAKQQKTKKISFSFFVNYQEYQETQVCNIFEAIYKYCKTETRKLVLGSEVHYENKCLDSC